MSDKLTVLDFKKVEKNTLRGFFTIRFNLMTLEIHNVMLHESAKNGSRWIVLPQKEYELDGKKRYQPIIEFTDKRMFGRFQESVLMALDEYMRGGTLLLSE